MSDLLVSEILILFLLFLPSVRPFSKSLKKAAALSILPFIALIISVLVIAGQGISFSLLPVIIIVIVCIITEFARFVMFLCRVPNDFYSIPSLLFRIFMLFLLTAVVFSCFYFSPESEYKTDYSKFLKQDVIIRLDGKKTNVGTCFVPKTSAHEQITVLVLGSFPNQIGNINTITGFLADAEYKTIELTNPENNYLWYMPKGGEEFISVFNSIIKKEIQINTKINIENFNSAISQIIENEKNSAVYVISEGIYNQAIYDYAAEHPEAFAGIFYVLSQEEHSSALSENRSAIKGINPKNVYVLQEDETLRFSKELGRYPVCFFLRSKEKLPHFGELRCRDVLAAGLLGSSRDLGKKDRIKVAEIFEKWLKIRSRITIGQR